MKVKRIVANIETDNIELAATFYGDVLGLQNVMNHGWIATYASSEESGTQVSFASQGGDGLPVPYLSIEVGDLGSKAFFCKGSFRQYYQYSIS
jgi:catechol 2,3-dioxygenase-like lactoylglutathione lyase family enzyme